MTIQNTAFKMVDKKPSKQDAAAIIEDLYNTDIQNLDPEGYKLTLARLYKHFIPALPKKPKTPFQWVSKAKSKEETRYYITEMYVRNNVLYATDGDRMHYINVDGYKDGYYTLNTKGDDIVPIELDGNFPQVEKIIPEKKNHDTFKLDDLVIDNGFEQLAYKIDIFGTSCYVNKKYMDDILSITDKTQIIDVYTFNPKKETPLLIEIGQYNAVLMPLNSLKRKKY